METDMITVRKKQNQIVYAFQLGNGSDAEKKLIADGRIVPRGEQYEVLSRESTDGRGEIADKGDYCKVDEGGMPYPIRKAWFEAHHLPLREYLPVGAAAGTAVSAQSAETEYGYVQIPEVLSAWMADDPEDEAVRTLLREGRLLLHPEDPEHFFEAELWGTRLTAPRNAVLVIYDLAEREFNFVDREIFEKTYDVIRAPKTAERPVL